MRLAAYGCAERVWVEERASVERFAVEQRGGRARRILFAEHALVSKHPLFVAAFASSRRVLVAGEAGAAVNS